MIGPSEEIELVQDCRKGDRHAQRRLYDMFAEAMMILCYRYIPDRTTAKDVLMEGFVDVFKNIERFTPQGEGSLRAWVKRIMINRCLMQLRKRRGIFVELEEDVNDVVSIDDGITEKLSVKEIMTLIHALPDGYRTVFNLYVFEDKSHKEIAEFLGISENTSKSQLFKAKALLQKKILKDK